LGIEVQKGNLDLIVGLQYSQVRGEQLLYILPAYEKLSFRYFSLNQEAKKINSYDDLRGKIIGMTRGATYFPAFEQDAALQKYPFSNLSTTIDMLLNKRIDLFLHYEESTVPLLKAMGVDHLIKKINYQPKYNLEHYLAISKNSPLAAKTKQLKEIIERGIDQQDFIQIRLEHYQQSITD
jgi:polar amino acid transport system substrate-binding protein